MTRAHFNFYRTSALVGATLWALTMNIAHADFIHALIDYKEGKFPEASAQFMELAALGDPGSQFNLGAMSLRGEGVPKSKGAGVGWLLASAENGSTQIAPQKLAEFKASLSPEELIEANKILERYGHGVLQRNVLPGPIASRTCRQFSMPRPEALAQPLFPLLAERNQQDGIVALDFIVGTDGLARDPHVLAAAPANLFEEATINAVLKSRFVPAVRNGEKIEAREHMKMTYSHEQGGTLWKLNAVKQVREEADKGRPGAKYSIGLLGTLDPTLDIPMDKAREMIIEVAKAGHPQAQYWVAQQLTNEFLCGDTNKVMPWLKQAAKGDDAAAQIEVVMQQLGSSSPDIDAMKQLTQSAAKQDNVYALKHAAAILASAPLEQLRDKSLALSTALRLKKYDDSLDPQVNEVMALAFAANDNFHDAIKQQEQAIKKGQKLYWNTAKMEERLEAYRGNRLLAGDVFSVPPSIKPPPPVGYELEDCVKRKTRCGRVPDSKKPHTGSFIPS